MANFNPRKKGAGAAARAHLNWMGGRSFDVNDPLLRLRLAASSCFFGEPMYYHGEEAAKPKATAAKRAPLSNEQREHLRATLHAIDPVEWRGLGPAELMERAIDGALARDPEATLAEAARLRTEEHVRTTPQVILVRAAHHPAVRGTGLVRRWAPSIVKRGDEPAVGLAYQLHRYGKPVPNALKKAWRDALARADSYTLAKYRLASRAVKTVDVVNLVHPRSPAVDALAKGELRATEQTWEAIVSARGSNRAAWLEALDVMGHMALLRNLRNLLDANVPTERFVAKLVAGAETGQQLPFRYWSAYCAVKDRAPKAVLGAIEQCLKRSVGALPRFPGRLMALCDNSGSAQTTTTSTMGTVQVSTIANLTGILAGMRADEGWLGMFGDELEARPVRAGGSVFAQLEAAEQVARGIGQNTENGVWLFWDRAIRAREHWDTVFVFSDMQAGHGGLYGTNPRAYRDWAWDDGHCIDVARLVAAYRRAVNPKVQVFLVQVAGYQDTLVPEFYDRTYVLGGWGEGLLRFAAEMASLTN